jgi:hypothetical protein
MSIFFLLTADGVDGRILRVRDDEGKLSTRMPAFGSCLGIGVVKVYRHSVVGWRVGVTKREEKYPPATDRPVWLSVSGMMHGRLAPFVSTTLEIWTGQLLVEFLPVLYPPSVHLKLVDLVPKIRHVLGGKCLVCTTLQSAQVTRSVIAHDAQSRTDTISSTSITGPPLAFSSRTSIVSA